MWVAFVFFGSPAHVYVIEGDNTEECKNILFTSFSKKGKVENGVSDIFENEYLTSLLGLFNIDDSVFNNPHNDPKFFKKSKDDFPKTLRARDGEFCKMCQQFCPMAVGNQADGSLVCWSCRDSNRWMFQ